MNHSIDQMTDNVVNRSRARRMHFLLLFNILKIPNNEEEISARAGAANLCRSL